MIELVLKTYKSILSFVVKNQIRSESPEGNLKTPVDLLWFVLEFAITFEKVFGAIALKLLPPCYWESDNEWRIPLLDLSMSPAALPLPFIPWGSQSQSRLMRGTWHCYVEDFKFEGLWNNPEKLLTSKPLCVVEPNFSIPWDAPGAIALYQIYRKRHCARYWQAQGIFTLVDLNVDYAHESLNLLGVPKGWAAYCTRGSCWDEEILKHQWAIAQNHSGKEKPLFVVYAGGKKVESLCRHEGWQYFDTYRGSMTYRGSVSG